MKFPALQLITGVAAATLIATGSAGAVEITPEFDLSGYIVGSGRYVEQDGSDTTLDLDATKLLTGVKTGPVSGTASLYVSGTDDVSLLDAYFTYEMGENTTITAGKFLSYHGYEAFDIPNMLQITYANENLEAIIPGYHKGVKLDMTSGASKFGVAVLDSVYASDGEIEDGIGFEGFYSYSTDNVTAFFGLAYDQIDNGSFELNSTTADFWLQYTTGALTIAGEIAYKTTDDDIGGDVDSYFILGLAQYEYNEGQFALFRFCWGEDDYDLFGSEGFTKYTVGFRQVVSDNFSILEEFSYSDFDSSPSRTFLGVQGRFTF